MCTTPGLIFMEISYREFTTPIDSEFCATRVRNFFNCLVNITIKLMERLTTKLFKCLVNKKIILFTSSSESGISPIKKLSITL